MGRVHSDIFREVNVQSGHQTYAGSEDGGSIPRSNSTYSVDKLVADLGPQGSIASNGVPNTGQYRHREGSKDSISIGNANYFDVMNFLPFGADGTFPLELGYMFEVLTSFEGSISSYPVSDFSSSPDVMSNQSFLASPSVAQWDAVGGIEMPSTAQPGPGIDMSTHGFPQTQFHPVQCQCLNHGIQILGDLELHIQQNTLASIDLTLAMQKRALLHSARMIDCKLCNTQSACKTTLILLCEKLIILFQSVAAVCLEQRKALRRQQLGENLGPNNTNFDTGQKMRLGEYELDSTHELGFVGSMLALLQGQRLLGMVARLKSFAVATGSDLQLSRLADSELRVANTMRDLKRASSDATGKT